MEGQPSKWAGPGLAQMADSFDECPGKGVPSVISLKPLTKKISMSTPDKAQFILLFSDRVDSPDPSPEEMQQIMGKWMGWLQGLKTQGVYVAGNRLEDGRKVIRGSKFTDGPFVESKEVVSGYIVVLAQDLAQAEKIGQGCPGLEYSTTVEVRPMMPSTI